MDVRPTQEPAPDWMTVKEAAVITGWPRTTIYRAIQAGTFPGQYACKSVRDR